MPRWSGAVAMVINTVSPAGQDEPVIVSGSPLAPDATDRTIDGFACPGLAGLVGLGTGCGGTRVGCGSCRVGAGFSGTIGPIAGVSVGVGSAVGVSVGTGVHVDSVVGVSVG